VAVKTVLTTQSREEQLLEFVRAVERHKDGRHALHVKLSQLSAENPISFAGRTTASFFHSMIKADEGRLFRLTSGDIIFVSNAASPRQMGDLQAKITRFFDRDPNVVNDPDGLITRFNLAQAYPEFLTLCETIAEEAIAKIAPLTAGGEDTHSYADPFSPAAENTWETDKSDHSTASDARAQDTSVVTPLKRAKLPRRILFEDEEVRALEPADLDRLESNFRVLDPTNLLMDMPVAALVGNMPPQIIFSEKAIDYEALQAAVLPSRNLKGDPILFQRLSRIVEHRLIQKLNVPKASYSLASSFPTNVSTVLSGAFIQFDRRHRRSSGAPIILDIRLEDALVNMAEFLAMRERVRDAGYRICLSGLSTYGFAAMDHSHRLADFTKVNAPDTANELNVQWLEYFENSARKAGFSRLICSNCDTAQDVENARALGFSLFQGQHINALIVQNARAAQTAARA